MFEETHKTEETKADQFIWAIVTNDMKEVGEILKKEPDVVNMSNKYGELPLNQAIRNKRQRVIDLLLPLGQLDVNKAGRDNITSLQEAAFQGDLATTKKLIARQVTRNKFVKGLSPLHIAIWKGRYDIAQFLLQQNFDVNGICDVYPDPGVYQQSRVTPLHCAAIGGDIDFIYLLAEHKADRGILSTEKNDAKTLFCTIHSEEQFEIEDKTYTPAEAFDLAFSRAQEDRAEKEQQSSVKSPTLFSKPANNLTKKSVDPVKIEEESLTSFNEIILGLVENLIGIKDEDVKKLYLNILFKPNPSCSIVAKYSADLDPIFGEQFSILYCCLNPSKWNESYMVTYKKFLINNYVDRSFESRDEILRQSKETWLIQYAEQFVRDLFSKNNVMPVELTHEETLSQQSVLKSIADSLSGSTIPNESLLKELEEQKKQIEEIQEDEGYGSDIDFHNLIYITDDDTLLLRKKNLYVL